MKFEMEFGYFGNNKLLVETSDFEIIQIFQEFVQFQEDYGWAVEYAPVLDDEEVEEDETLEETMSGQAVE